MAQETKRVPAFLSGPTTATAVLLPMRLYVGWWWLQLGIDKLGDGWLRLEAGHLASRLEVLDPPGWFAVTFVEGASEHTVLFQWLIVLSELVFGAAMLAGLATRVAGLALAIMAGVAFIAFGYPTDSWMLPMGLMAITLAAAAAGRYLGIDAILRARQVKIPLF
jgi:uncharacterized membrane protein YphA (DoxX/SURF4 family)